MPDKFKIGDKVELIKSFSIEDGKLFSKLAGDENPIHFNEDFAKNTHFKTCIVPGMLASSTFSGMLATDLPGNGTIYLNQYINFLAPIYYNINLIFQLEIINIRDDKPIFTISTKCIDETKRILIEGEALVYKKY